MECPFITGKYILTCTSHALAEIYVPSLFELEEYCKNTRHKMCPLKQRQGGYQAGGNTSRNKALLQW